jgi:hypothetical protein
VILNRSSSPLSVIFSYIYCSNTSLYKINK